MNLFLSKHAALRNCIRRLLRDEATTELIAEDADFLALDADDRDLIESLSLRLEETSHASVLKREAELHALQNQINPHFLYNTLEVIRSKALQQGAQDVAEMAESLALQFRYCINNPGDMATLEQELEHVKNYLLIQHYRLGNRFRYEEILHDPDGVVLHSRMPVITLQPIVENALMHGINPKVEGGTVTMRIRARGERLHIAVEDDGVGMTEEMLQKMRGRLTQEPGQTVENEKTESGSGIALRNVNQRIKVLFGESYGLEVSSTLGVGTGVFLTLPLTQSV